MRNRLFAAAATLVVIAVTAGCSEETKPERTKNAEITVDGKTQTTQEILCTQVDWSLTITTKAVPTQTSSLLELGGEKPIAKTVNIHDFGGFSGVAGEGRGQADVSLAKNDYVIAGTAEGSDAAHPGKTRSASFRIQAHC
jgi:lipoprotein LpqH